MGVIYALHLGDRNYRYVGKTVNSPEYRLSQHVKDAKAKSSLPVHRWIRKNPPGAVVFDILYSSENEKLLLEMEKAFIRSVRESGYDLLNLTDGGHGISGYVMSDEQKLKLSVLRKGKPGHPHTEEHKARMSEKFKGRGLPWVDKIIESRGDKFKGEGNPRAKLSQSQVEDILYLWSLQEWPCAAAIAEYFDVTKGNVERIISGQSWRHLERPIVDNMPGRKRVTRARARKIVDSAFEARRRMKEDGK